MVNLQVDRQRQLVAELFIQLIQQFAAHVHDLVQRVDHLRPGLFLALGHQMIDVILALEQIVALLIDIELRQPQIGDARVHIRQQRALRQALLLLIQNARQHGLPFST